MIQFNPFFISLMNLDEYKKLELLYLIINFFKMNYNKEIIAKILIIGEAKVGKTSILTRYTEGIFLENLMPTLGRLLLCKLTIRDRLPPQEDRDRRQGNQAADLGHRRPGTVSLDHAELLQGRSRHSPGLRPQRHLELRDSEQLAREHQVLLRQRGLQDHHWQ